MTLNPTRPSSITPALEDYLEAILEAGSPARVTAVAARMGVAKASVTEAARKLSARRLVTYPRYGRISLTNRGAAVAREVLSRHRALASWLTRVLGVAPVTAERDACVLEHGLSPETASRLLAYVTSLASAERARRRPVKPDGRG
jgi:DtxR family Mn-dependent transcriptional regulator